jgi:hypothetical protein
MRQDGVLYSVRLGICDDMLTFEVFLLLFVFSPIVIIKELKTKQSKVNLLMLPATNMEKFVSRYVMVTLVWMLSFAVQFIVADLLQWLLALIAHPAENGLVMTQLFTHKINLIMVTKHHYILFGILLLWWLHSFYLVGGMFFVVMLESSSRCR